MPGYKKPLDPDLLANTGKCKWRLYVSNKFRADGKPNRISQTIGPCSEAQADKKLQELYLEFTKKPPQNANRIRFNQFAEIWLERRRNAISPNTFSGYRNALDSRLIPYFGHIRLNKISADIITDYLNDLKADGERLDNHSGDIAPATIFWYFRILRTMFNKAKEWNYITHNPIDDIPKDKRPRPNYKVKPILEDDQLGILLQKLFELKENVTNVKNQLFFYLALITGARSGELIALTWNDINFDNMQITISKDIYTEHNQTRIQNRTKGMETRTVYCDDFCISLLRKHKTYQTEWLHSRKIENPNQYIFLKRTVKKSRQPEAELPSRSSFHHFMRSFLKKNGLPSIDVHGFRRMAASYSVNNQVPLTTVQTMLGHKSLSTTMIYLRTLNASRKEGVEALSNTYQQLMDRKKDDKPEDDSPKP